MTDALKNLAKQLGIFPGAREAPPKTNFEELYKHYQQVSALQEQQRMSTTATEMLQRQALAQQRASTIQRQMEDEKLRGLFDLGQQQMNKVQNAAQYIKELENKVEELEMTIQFLEEQ